MTYPNRTIPRDTLERMVRTVGPTWTVETTDLLDGGYLSTYRLTFGMDGSLREDDEDARECILKASPDGEGHGVALESRILAILREHSSIPVPTVLGCVDAREDLPSPFFLMEPMAGRARSKSEMDDLSAESIERIARSTGRHLAELHAIEAVDSFGFLQPAPGSVLDGSVPSGAFDTIEVVDPADSWRAFLRESADGIVEAHSDGQFADLASDARPVLDASVENLEGPFRPVLGHIDNSLENVLVDPQTGNVTAMLDWAFTLAVTPAYDLAFVVHSLAGGPWWYVPSTPDHKSLVREALLAGYRERGSKSIVQRYRANRGCYELLSTLHSMFHFEDRLAFDGATDDQIEAAAERHREVLVERI